MSWNEEAWKRYLEGSATKEQLESLESYFRSGKLEAWNELLAKEQLTNTPMPTDQEERLRRYLLQLENKRGSRVRTLFTARRIAAAAIVIILLGAAYLLRPSKVNDAQIAKLPAWDTIGPAADVVRMVTLEDGTKIWLNRQAELLISKAYPQERLLRLKGEGYFEVTADRAHPFSVQTGEVQTTVLGTAFNIENTLSDKTVRVSLLNGKVKVTHRKDTAAALVLQPGHMAIAADNAAKIATAEIDVSTAAAWIKGDLVMNNIPLADAVSKLAAYYNIQITCPSGLSAGKMVTALYHRYQPWKQVLQHMLFIAQLTYTTDKNGTIHIKKISRNA